MDELNLKPPEVYKYFQCCGHYAALYKGQYLDGRTCWFVTQGGEVIGKLSVNIPCEHLEEGEFFVHGEETKYLKGILEATGAFEKTGRIVEMGFATAEVWKLKEE
jgi:hypothetical protein